MKERLKKSSPKISGRANLENMNQIRNLVFGKSKSMGIDDEKKEMAKQNAYNKKNKSTATKKGKVDVGLSEALKKQKNKKKPSGMSPGALGGKVKPSSVTKQKKKMGQAPTKTNQKKKTIVTKEQLAKSGLSLRDYMNFMQGKTRKDDKKSSSKKVNLKKSQMPKKKPTMVDDFSKSKVKKKKTSLAKTGLGSKSMSTKTPKTYKGTNITPTKLQKERMRKRMMGST